MMTKRQYYIIATSIFITLASFVLLRKATGDKSPPPELFDVLITNDLIEIGCEEIVPFAMSSIHEVDQLNYTINFELDTDDNELFSAIQIQITNSSVPRPVDSMFLGPGGGGDQSVTTTLDGQFHIIVTQSNMGSEDVKSPVIYTSRIVTELAERYRELVTSRN